MDARDKPGHDERGALAPILIMHRALNRRLLRQAMGDMRRPVPRQHLGFIGLLGAVDLPDLLGTALDGGFAMFGSDLVRIYELLRDGRLAQQQRSCKNYTQK
jgi:hypothetical protein